MSPIILRICSSIRWQNKRWQCEKRDVSPPGIAQEEMSKCPQLRRAPAWCNFIVHLEPSREQRDLGQCAVK